MRVDFHTHSCFSDGRLEPEELLWEAQKLGLGIISLTDHETTGGIKRARARARQIGVKFIPGVEISTDWENKEHHLLGYLKDYDNQQLATFFDYWRKTKLEQIREMVKGLRDIGFSVSFEAVMAQVRDSANRPHIAYAVFERPENKLLLDHFEIKTTGDFFRKFLKEKGEHSVYCQRAKPSVESAISLIKRINGITVWAHPFFNASDFEAIKRLAKTFKGFGLDGVEVFYPFHDREKALGLHEMARGLDLLETAGSDFHSFDMDMLNKIADFETFGLEPKLGPILEIGG